MIYRRLLAYSVPFHSHPDFIHNKSPSADAEERKG
jgi:hypothetical protein